MTENFRRDDGAVTDRATCAPSGERASSTTTGSDTTLTRHIPPLPR